MFRFIVLSMAILWSYATLAQKPEKEPPLHIIPQEYAAIHHEGEKAMLQGNYNEAIRSFKKVLRKYPDFPPALRTAGACHELKGEVETAIEMYQKAIEVNPYFSRAIYWETGNLCYKTGRYKKALKYFDQFDSLLVLDNKMFTYNGFEERKVEEKYYGKLEGSRRACDIALDSIQFWNIPSVQNLGGSINTKADEYFPFLTNDGNTIFYTSRKHQGADENLFHAVRPNEDWRIGEKVKGFNSKGNEGMTTLVRDGRHLFFTACGREQVLGTCDIWQAKIDGTDIYDIQPTIGYANSGNWESQASVSCDGSVLFFSSNREGGYGGADIWMSERLPDGRWAEPKNLGDKINTSDDEEAPFITNDGRTLYFSSTGHTSLGEQDIFMTKIGADNTWEHPVNLGMPVNSSYRELGFFLSADGKTGYFASDREEGFGGMDIYKFELPEQLTGEPITYVQGTVKDSITHLPIQTTVHFKNRPAISTDEEGRFFLCVDALDTLYMDIRAEDYREYSGFAKIPEWENHTFFHLNILLDPLFRLPVYTGRMDKEVEATTVALKSPFGKPITHQVLFEFDKADLKSESVEDLEKFLGQVFDGNSVANVEVVGYADDVGDDNYNFILSEKRAKTVGVYLKEKGIRVDKIYIEGKGSTRNNQPKWRNRKVEVVVHLTQ